MFVGFVILNVLAYNHAYAMTHFSPGGVRTGKPEQLSALSRLKVLLMGVNLPRPVTRRLPGELDPTCKELTIPGFHDIKLSAWYVSHGDKTPLVIFFHGYGAEKSSQIREAKVFLDMGLSVLLVDFRGCGGSSESYATIGVLEGEDVASVVRFVKGNMHHTSVILCGQSMGAVSILRAVHDYGVKPDGVILEAVFDTMLNTVRNRFHTMGVPSFPSAELLVFWGGWQWGFNGFSHNPVDYASSLTCPALFMHGADDPRAKLIEGERVFDAAAGPKEFIKFDHTGHESYLHTHPVEWRAAVQTFLKRIAKED